MNTLLSYASPLFSFLLAVTLTSLTGLVFYLFARWLSHKHPDLLAFFAWVFVVAALYGVCLTGSLLLLLSLVAICFFGGLAERAAYVPRRNLIIILPQIWLAMGCNVVFSAGWLIMLSLSRSRTTASERWFDTGTILGAFVSPSAISFFIYLWKSSRPCSGLDAPLGDEQRPFS